MRRVPLGIFWLILAAVVCAIAALTGSWVGPAVMLLISIMLPEDVLWDEDDGP